MHNFSNVLRFEIVRTIKKPTFWLSLFSIPVLIAIITGIVFFSSKTSDDAERANSEKKFSLLIKDETGIVSDTVVKAIGAEKVTNSDQAITAVQNGLKDAYFEYPSDVTKAPIKVYNKNDGLIENGKYADTAKLLLTQSAITQVEPNLAYVVAGNTQTESVTFSEGKEINLLGSIIPPAFFIVIFYAIILLLGGQMLTSTIEEKENRVTEMLLTSLSSRTLIVAKIVSLAILGVIQMLVIAMLPLLLYIFARDTLNIPDLSGFLATLEFDPFRIFIGFAFLLTGLTLFTGFLVAIGAATPTAKEANSFFGFVILIMFAPFYFFSLLMTKTQNIVVDIMTYFPLTAPITIMIRNAFDTIQPYEAIIGLVIVSISAIVALALAVRIFRYGTLEYSSRLSLKTIFKRV